MGRPNKDRVMVSYYVARSGKAAVEELAERLGQTKAATYRELLRLGLQHHPSGCKQCNSRSRDTP